MLSNFTQYDELCNSGHHFGPGEGRDVGTAEAPGQPGRGAAADREQPAVLAALVMEAAECDQVPAVVGATARAVDDVVDLEIAAR
jgi:hypothetical protein